MCQCLLPSSFAAVSSWHRLICITTPPPICMTPPPAGKLLFTWLSLSLLAVSVFHWILFGSFACSEGIQSVDWQLITRHSAVIVQNIFEQTPEIEWNTIKFCISTFCLCCLLVINEDDVVFVSNLEKLEKSFEVLSQVRDFDAKVCGASFLIHVFSAVCYCRCFQKNVVLRITSYILLQFFPFCSGVTCTVFVPSGFVTFKKNIVVCSVSYFT